MNATFGALNHYGYPEYVHQIENIDDIVTIYCWTPHGHNTFLKGDTEYEKSYIINTNPYIMHGIKH